jgi:predicted MPP superfamily phosphohydrolase
MNRSLLRLTRRDVVKGLAGAAGLAALPAAADCTPGRDALYFEIAKLELKVKGLDPAHDGLLVAQLSDIHVGRSPNERVTAAVAALNAAKPDLAVLTGDYVTTKRDPFERVPQLLKGIEAPTYAVLGNHDHLSNAPYLKWRLEGIGCAVLQNQRTTLRLKGADFHLLGVDDSTTRHDDLEQTMKGTPAGSRLMLAHTPSFARKLPKDEGLLCLSGHTHGGQIHIPGKWVFDDQTLFDVILKTIETQRRLWNDTEIPYYSVTMIPFVKPARPIPGVTTGVFGLFGQPFIRGHHAVNGNQVYVNRGLGFGRGTGLVRVDSEPELSLITLRAA